MRLRHCLYVLASVLGLLMLSPALVHSQRQLPDADLASSMSDESTTVRKEERVVLPAPVPTPLRLEGKSKAYRTAYMDAYRILSEENQCSGFYGGPSAALSVFNPLMSQLRTDFDPDSTIGISMSGPVTYIDDKRTGRSYRLFAEAKINLNGPFYKNKSVFLNRPVASVGSFPPNTREARVLLLLHELGHLVQGPEKHWLLPNDGDDVRLSVRNTKTVQTQCDKQIRELVDGVSRINNSAGEKPARGATAALARSEPGAEP